MLGSKSYGTISRNGVHRAAQKIHKNERPFFFQIFFSKIIFLSTCEALFHSIQANNEKVMDNLIFLDYVSIFLKK